MSYTMKKITNIDNHFLLARESDKNDQSLSDYLCENKVYGDGRTDYARLCLMNNCHAIYFEFWGDGKQNQIIGFFDVVDLTEGWNDGISNFLEQELLDKMKNRIPKYISCFKEVSNG